MVEIDTFKKIALSFPETTEVPHFDKSSYRVGKKIFATLHVKNQLACLKLSIMDQDLFSVFDKSVIYPVPNKWGKQGWTYIDLNSVPEETLRDALKTAYKEVIPKLSQNKRFNRNQT